MMGWVLTDSSEFILVLSAFLLHISRVSETSLRRLKRFDLYSLLKLVGRMNFPNGSNEQP